MTDIKEPRDALPSFEAVWRKKVAEGYHYGGDALENVRFGFVIASREFSDHLKALTAERDALKVENEELRKQVPPDIEGGRFEGYSSDDFIGQLRLQANCSLDAEYSSFIAATAKHLSALQSQLREAEEALRKAIRWFEEYSVDHYAKARMAGSYRDQNGYEIKGKRNQDRAEELRNALRADQQTEEG